MVTGVPDGCGEHAYSVLIMTGDHELRASIRDLLVSTGVHSVSFGADLPGRPVRHDLVLVDVKLSTAVELIGGLRAEGTQAIIALVENEADVREAVVAGADSWLTKPGCHTPLAVRSPLLSSAEIRVLELVAEGQSNPEISVSTGLPQKVVGDHLRRLGRKLGKRRRPAMVLAALRAGIIT
ncbi:LuxR C-terminal-related transcriptional regulator [Lentzea sp. NPDC059081]|uniref:helix-turn-helix transcriptional regulator n=1 Tax=Lentzea sp. NPDC059081 TaxID=3346719 RepID=UPI0036AB3B79